MKAQDVNKMGNIKNQEAYDRARGWREGMKVKIGDFYTICCELDFDYVNDEETRKEIQEELDEGNEVGIQVWKTEEEVKEFFKGSSEYERILDVIAKKREEVSDNAV